ncbi:MAG: endonuclease [Paludibacteraceae bacterium]|nr:endonuclease [Paludibacteraceae bacterium]MEE0951511.1 endonuclease [Paludibacteraceae bacterium]
MKKIILIYLSLTLVCGSLFAAIGVDMQAHMGTKEAQEAYSTYVSKQAAYYKGTYSYSNLSALSGNDLFGALNTLMGNTSRIGGSSFSYNSLRDQYKNVDKDLNRSGYIIGYYNGASFSGVWDSGATWNREHTWPQSKGANKSIPMGHDMQSVRPTHTTVNSSRGNDAYGESGAYYDPDEVSISNSYYKSTNMGSYRGDAARVILYDYVVYGEAGGHKNSLYNGNAQLLSKFGSAGVFESAAVLLKWHMNDPVSLTEMVRNDGAQTYQGNRNPFIDYPELAIQVLKNASGVKTYTVTTTGTAMWPNYTLTLNSGFVAYLGTPDARPQQVTVTGATYTYDSSTGRLIIKSVTGAVSITTTTTAMEEIETAPTNYKTIHNGQVVIIRDGKMYNMMGQQIAIH